MTSKQNTIKNCETNAMHLQNLFVFTGDDEVGTSRGDIYPRDNQLPGQLLRVHWYVSYWRRTSPRENLC